MLSAKSFRPSINAFDQGLRWIRIFAADIFSRLVDEGVLENKRRPKVTTLHVRHGGDTRSRQTPIPQGKTITEASLFDLAKMLLSQMITEGNVWPCSNISLSVGGFEDGVKQNLLISQFLVKGEEVKASGESTGEMSSQRPGKRRRTEDNGIYKFLTKNDTTEENDDDLEHQADTMTENGRNEHNHLSLISTPDTHQLERQSPSFLTCERCKKQFRGEEELLSHGDWHFAKDLQNEDRSQSVSAARPEQLQKPGKNVIRPSSTKKPGTANGERKVEKGQKRLNFGP